MYLKGFLLYDPYKIQLSFFFKQLLSMQNTDLHIGRLGMVKHVVDFYLKLIYLKPHDTVFGSYSPSRRLVKSVFYY